MTLNATVFAQIAATLSSVGALGSPTFDSRPASSVATAYLPGTGPGQADKLFADERTLAASTSENLDLAGVLTDPLGAPLTFVNVKAILIRAAAGNSNDVIVGGAASNAFLGPFGASAHTIAVPPGGHFLWNAPVGGKPVTPGTGDLLKVANGGAGTPVTYDVEIIGTSA